MHRQMESNEEGDQHLPRTSPPRRAPRQWFWVGFILILLFSLALSIIALIRSGTGWVEKHLPESGLPPLVNEAIRVTIAPGESVYVDAVALAHAQEQALDLLDKRINAAQSKLTTELDQGLKHIFAETERHIPAFADWYYSIAGEYTRLAYAVAGNLPGYLAQKIDELVFTPAGTARGIDNLSSTLKTTSAAAVVDAVQEVRNILIEVLLASGLPADRVHVTGEWNLGGELGTHLERYVDWTPQDTARQAIATTAGAAVATATAKKLGSAAVAKAAGKLAAKPAAATTAKLAAKLGLNAASKAGGTAGATGTGAAAGAALCAGTVAGAPLSPGCALIGGAITGIAFWLLVDKVVIEADEYLYRGDFEADLHSALVEQCTELRAELAGRYVEGTTSTLQRLRGNLEKELAPHMIAPTRDFVPKRAADGMGQTP